MESSEDDAGTATSASCRISAREKDVGQAQVIDATSCYHQESYEAQTSCVTPAMSEDNFDGDSVPSPSAQDVNTSTEAILDMIDEIVDGPGAPKRIPLSLQTYDSSKNAPVTICNRFDQEQNSTKSDNVDIPSPLEASTSKAETSENLCKVSYSEVHTESSSIHIKTTEPKQIECMNLSSSIVPKNVELVSETPESNYLQSSVEPETSSIFSLNIPSTSVIQHSQNTFKTIDNVHLERTVKCVSSSDNNDSVTVNSAESTSSDCSISEGKASDVENSVRSPLKRRLVRPAPCDRRPDSTVSSTADSQHDRLVITESISSECLTKDVSSSSDAVPSLHGSVKPEEIRNISEISICKAETSVSPPKKIKLIRQRITPAFNKNDIQPSTSISKQAEPIISQSPLVKISSDLLEPISCISSHECSNDKKTDNVQSAVEDNQVNLLLKKDIYKEYTKVKSIESTSVASADFSLIDVPLNKDNKTVVECKKHELVEPSLLNSTSPKLVELEKVLTNIKQSSDNIEICMKEETHITVDGITKAKECENVEHKTEKNLVELNIETTELHDVCLKVSEISNALPDHSELVSLNESSNNDQEVGTKLSPIKLNLSQLSESIFENTIKNVELESVSKSSITQTDSEPIKQIPKLTIKLSKPSEEPKSPGPKVTIKPIRPPSDNDSSDKGGINQQIPSITKLNIKPILKPEKLVIKNVESEIKLENEHIPSITKLNIKPILKPPEKINDIHRKSSSSEISESEYSENDDSTSTSDQASTSDNGTTDVIPKVTIKLGKPGTQSEGKFYTEKNVPKLTIKGLQNTEKSEQESVSKLKVILNQSEDKQLDKIPKFTIKTVPKSEGQPLSPKLTIKPIKPPEPSVNESEIPRLKISTETILSQTDSKENVHVPKITIKPITRPEVEIPVKVTKKSILTDNPEHIPVITKLNIKPILKPSETGERLEVSEDKVPVVSKLNIKPIVKPKDIEVDSSIEDVPKITKLNIKPLKVPEVKGSGQENCDELNADISNKCIPVVTKINIKPIFKPLDEEQMKDSENQSSETGNSSDDNGEHIPAVKKLNIKPVLKPVELEETRSTPNESSIPVVTKLNIKPLVKPEENPSSPKKESSKTLGPHSPTIPIITKLNIKPVLKPDDTEILKLKEDSEDKSIKNPPLVMKINMKAVTDSRNSPISSIDEHTCNSINDNLKIKTDVWSSNQIETATQRISSNRIEMLSSLDSNKYVSPGSSSEKNVMQNCLPDSILEERPVEPTSTSQKEGISLPPMVSTLHNKLDIPDVTTATDINETSSEKTDTLHKSARSTLQYCTLLKKLLENPKEKSAETHVIAGDQLVAEKLRSSPSLLKETVNCDERFITKPDNENLWNSKSNLEIQSEYLKPKSPDKVNNTGAESESEPSKVATVQDFCKVVNENDIKPLEISISDKNLSQSSGQDSPRIILKINKTDHGPLAEIITESMKKPDLHQNDNMQDLVNDKSSPKKQIENCRKKSNAELSIQNLSVRTRLLRSSRKVENVDTTPVKQNTGKRSSSSAISPPQNRENEMSVLDAKRLKLGQILSGNAMLTPNVSISPVVARVTQSSPMKPALELRQGGKLVNHSILNDNCAKNGNSKLHNILSNLHAKQMRSMPFNDISSLEKAQSTSSEIESNASTGSSEAMGNTSNETQTIELQEMLLIEKLDFRDLSGAPEELSQDPLEPESTKSNLEITNGTDTPQPMEMTPQPKKRGRPRKLPLTDSPKPPVLKLPISALEERPQRSLRLTRERPIVPTKPRGRGRGRGRGSRRGSTLLAHGHTPVEEPERVPTPPSTSPPPIDPTSSRIKLPRMTEALDKMPSSGSTPLSSGTGELKLFTERAELKVVLEPTELDDSFMKSPEVVGRPRGGRGSRGGRIRTPRGRGRGRGGGRGAMYMKETMGIYGRVCGPATTTIQLFEEETCMMDDNATPAKPANLMDEDSQSSVKSSTNESSKMKKSKFADLFDSNKVWTAADVKEYTWPPKPRSDMESQVMMIQEQVAMFLGVKSFKRRYPELKRRTIVGEERDYVFGKGLVTEALCDLGITAVDASEVLDIMLSDYPHKYEEYRSHQREKQLTEVVDDTLIDTKNEDKVVKVEVKPEKNADHKPELPKVDPERTRQDMAAAAIASASEWNARVNALRRPACVDLQSLAVHVRRAGGAAPPLPPAHPAPPAPPPTHVRPPAGFYPHALLPGQYQHWYREYTADELRYFPLSTAWCAPLPPAVGGGDCSSSSEGERERERDRDDCDSDAGAHYTHPTHHNKRKKLTKTKRSSQTEVFKDKEESRSSITDVEVDTCRVCKLRLEANRKYTHERFLVCANCNAKLHPGCVELGPDTIRKCREYAWQCAECKSCCACHRPADDDKMLFCDLCDRGFHIYCVGLDTVPHGRWHCVECAICKSCGARDPSGLASNGANGASGSSGASGSGASSGPSGASGASGQSDPTTPAEWHHQTKRGPGGHKCYSHSLCTPCARVR